MSLDNVVMMGKITANEFLYNCDKIFLGSTILSKICCSPIKQALLVKLCIGFLSGLIGMLKVLMNLL